EWFTGMIDQPGSNAYLGGRYAGDAETTWIRCHFIGPSQVGIFLNGYNVLDYWVWDSLFENVQYGLANATYSGGGAGGFAANRNMFLGSTYADMAIGNTNFFSARWNYSKGSAQFIGGGPIGNSPAPWTVHGNTILGTAPALDHNIIDLGNPGPLVLLDNTMAPASASGVSHIRVGEPYSGSDYGSGEVVGLGSTYAMPAPSVYEARSSLTRIRSVDDAFSATVAD